MAIGGTGMMAMPAMPVGTGLMRIISGSQLSAFDKAQAEADEQSGRQLFISSLTSHIQKCFNEAEQHKQQQVLPALEECARQRRGQYSPAQLAEIEQQGGSDIFINLTNVKCRAAEAWIKDVVLTGGDQPWTIEATPIPDLPRELETAVSQVVLSEAQAVMVTGEPVMPETITLRAQMIREELMIKLNDIARRRAAAMEKKIADQLAEGKFAKAFKQFINDFTTYQTAFIKGPIVVKRKRLDYVAGKPAVAEQLVREFVRVSPFDIYPSPDACSTDEGYVLERHRLHASELQALIGVPGYKEDQIREVLAEYGEKGYTVQRFGDMERDQVENRASGFTTPRTTIEALQFWGPVSGRMLKEWADKEAVGMGVDSCDDDLFYEVEAWLVGSFVIRAVLNPDPFGRRPYHHASWDEVPGSIWGGALPDLMGDLQRMINACGRALNNNMGIASGPQVEINVDRLPDGQTDIEDIYPWKIWQTRQDRMGTGQPAVRFYQPDSRANELLATIQQLYQKADEVTGIPNYTYGSAAVGGAGRTASGLSMLMDNAAKGLKNALSNLDVAISGLIGRIYQHNILFDPDPMIKGDCRVVAKGALGLIAREALQARRNEFLQATTNPVDLQILGQQGRAYLLREMAKGLQLDTGKIVPDPERLSALMQAANAGQPPVQQGATLDAAGTPVADAPQPPSAGVM